MLRELKKIKLAWPELNYTTAKGVLILHPSTPPSRTSIKASWKTRFPLYPHPLPGEPLKSALACGINFLMLQVESSIGKAFRKHELKGLQCTYVPSPQPFAGQRGPVSIERYRRRRCLGCPFLRVLTSPIMTLS